jgi:hypothetical protein
MNRIMCIIVVALVVGQLKAPAAVDPSALTLVEAYNDLHMVTRIDIYHGSELFHSIGLLNEMEPVDHYAGPWRLGLPYGQVFFEDIQPWDPIPIPGIPTLLVLEYKMGGATGYGHQWQMRILLLEDGKIREIPPIDGGGEIYMFRDFNGDGSLEFANQEYLYWHEVDADGIPLSPRIFRFNGDRYEPVTTVETWDSVLDRQANWRQEQLDLSDEPIVTGD